MVTPDRSDPPKIRKLSVVVPVFNERNTLVEIVRRDQPATDADPELLVSLLERGFNQRRKMLRRSLAERVTPEQFEAAGIDPQDRPERLSVEDWGRLATAVAADQPTA